MKSKIAVISISLFALFASDLVSAHADEIPVITDAGPLAPIEFKGPGSRIHGADISRWQHPNNKLINFKKMSYLIYSLLLRNKFLSNTL